MVIQRHVKLTLIKVIFRCWKSWKLKKNLQKRFFLSPGHNRVVKIKSRNFSTQQENLLRFSLLLLKRRTPFLHQKWRILLISSSCRVQPKTEFQRNSFWGELRCYSSSGVLLSSTKNGWFSSFPPLVENPPCSLCLRRILQKRSSVGIPFIEKRF